jgi:hypothetical protein
LLTGQAVTVKAEMGVLQHLPALPLGERFTDFMNLIESIHAKVDTIQTGQVVEAGKAKRPQQPSLVATGHQPPG